jgi:hypothetical protein
MEEIIDESDCRKRVVDAKVGGKNNILERRNCNGSSKSSNRG